MQKFCAEYVAKQYIKTLDKFFWEATICGLAALLHLIGAAFIQNDFVNVIFKTSEGVSVSIGGAVAALVPGAFMVASGIIAVVFSKKSVTCR